MVYGDECDPTLCCDYEEQITIKAGVSDQDFEITPEELYPGQWETVDIRHIFWEYTNFEVC